MSHSQHQNMAIVCTTKFQKRNHNLYPNSSSWNSLYKLFLLFLHHFPTFSWSISYSWKYHPNLVQPFSFSLHKNFIFIFWINSFWNYWIELVQQSTICYFLATLGCCSRWWRWRSKMWCQRHKWYPSFDCWTLCRTWSTIGQLQSYLCCEWYPWL